MDFTVKQQVMWKRGLGPRGHAQTREIRIGEIVAMAGETAMVSFPIVGGRQERKEIKLSELEPVSKVYGRSAVQVNPLHRQVVVGF